MTMACFCCSSPYSARQYPYPTDESAEHDENVPLRTFGKFRSGSVLVPDDIDGLPSIAIPEGLASDTSDILYQAEIDQGRACRGMRLFLCVLTVISLPFAFLYACVKSVISGYGVNCDESCQWVRKEYSSRIWYRVYSNRIETNAPQCRLFGMFGCGSWNSDVILTHLFDRGAFGFRRVPAGLFSYLCCLWPVYGWSIARQRCPCNGPLWHGGWWCDEWICDMCFCSYHYHSLADGDETAFASSIALQAYFEGRAITKEDMDECTEYWRQNISEQRNPEERKRSVMCEPCCIPCPTAQSLYNCCHFKRNIPYGDDDKRNTMELRAAYDKYNELCEKQKRVYAEFTGPVRTSTVCRILGCRRVFGRKGLFFCTEGCSNFCWLHKKKPGDPPPPFEHRHLDDDNDASIVLHKVLGDPPTTVRYTRWTFDEETNEHVLVTYPKLSDEAEDVETGDAEGLISKGTEMHDDAPISITKND